VVETIRNDPLATLLQRRQAGADIWIDRRTSGIAHAKAIIIDGRLTIGASYNYTDSAEHRNVEDVTFTDSRSIAASFEANWSVRRLKATPGSPHRPNIPATRPDPRAP
jgi:phosphatidylserine/phosphatidylglycerophosphate/cardiolipin synthase-like enzyme